MSSIIISNNTIPNAHDAIALYVSLNWGTEQDYDTVEWQRVLKNSRLITAWDGKKLIGITRFMTDGYHDTCVTECCVAPDYQGEGVGRTMMDHLLKLYGHTSVYVNALDGRQGFFQKIDFSERPAMNVMSRKGVRKAA